LKIADLKDLQLISQIREDIEELFEKSPHPSPLPRGEGT
jgi:hypothetical protein